MSKNIGIKEGGLSRLFGPLRKLKTTLQAGGFCFWIPKDEITLTTKSITKNGVYNAADDGYSGYSSVTVNVTTGDVVTGKGQDGNEYVVQKDGSGKLVEDKVPSTIEVTKLPNVITYGVGAFLGFDGIEVTAYYADGSSYGVIPFEDLVFPVTQAPWEPATAEYQAVSSLISDPIPYDRSVTIVYTDGDTVRYTFSSGTGRVTAYLDGGWVRCLAASDQPNAVFDYYTTMQYSYTYDNKTVYYGLREYSWKAVASISPDANGDIRINQKEKAWTMIYGDVITTGGFQVPVHWNRPDDGKTLETSYGITVVSGPSGNDN